MLLFWLGGPKGVTGLVVLGCSVSVLGTLATLEANASASAPSNSAIISSDDADRMRSVDSEQSEGMSLDADSGVTGAFNSLATDLSVLPLLSDIEAMAGIDLRVLGGVPVDVTEIDEDPDTDTAATRAAVVELARRQIGDLYVAGGDGPHEFDCSGLTQFVVKETLGTDIGDTTWEQVRRLPAISIEEALPGDLVFSFAGEIHHVGIYLGDNTIIEAPRPGAVVKVSRLDSGWWVGKITNVAKLPV